MSKYIVLLLRGWKWRGEGCFVRAEPSVTILQRPSARITSWHLSTQIPLLMPILLRWVNKHNSFKKRQCYPQSGPIHVFRVILGESDLNPYMKGLKAVLEDISQPLLSAL